MARISVTTVGAETLAHLVERVSMAAARPGS